MREIQASEAKTHLAQLLDDIGRGESIIITLAWPVDCGADPRRRRPPRRPG
jgi:hypothetical protein